MSKICILVLSKAIRHTGLCRKHEAEFMKLKALSDDDDNGDLELNEEMKELEKQLMKKDP